MEPPSETENSLVRPSVDDEDNDKDDDEDEDDNDDDGDDEEDHGDRNFLHFPGTTFSRLNVAAPSCQFLRLLDFFATRG